jgi:hypothetical protein
VKPTEGQGRVDQGRGQVDNVRQNDNDTLSTSAAAFDKPMTANQNDGSGYFLSYYDDDDDLLKNATTD